MLVNGFAPFSVYKYKIVFTDVGSKICNRFAVDFYASFRNESLAGSAAG